MLRSCAGRGRRGARRAAVDDAARVVVDPQRAGHLDRAGRRPRLRQRRVLQLGPQHGPWCSRRCRRGADRLRALRGPGGGRGAGRQRRLVRRRRLRRRRWRRSGRACPGTSGRVARWRLDAGRQPSGGQARGDLRHRAGGRSGHRQRRVPGDRGVPGGAARRVRRADRGARPRLRPAAGVARGDRPRARRRRTARRHEHSAAAPRCRDRCGGPVVRDRDDDRPRRRDRALRRPALSRRALLLRQRRAARRARARRRADWGPRSGLDADGERRGRVDARGGRARHRFGHRLSQRRCRAADGLTRSRHRHAGRGVVRAARHRRRCTGERRGARIHGQPGLVVRIARAQRRGAEPRRRRPGSDVGAGSRRPGARDRPAGFARVPRRRPRQRRRTAQPRRRRAGHRDGPSGPVVRRRRPERRSDRARRRSPLRGEGLRRARGTTSTRCAPPTARESRVSTSPTTGSSTTWR